MSARSFLAATLAVLLVMAAATAALADQTSEMDVGVFVHPEGLGIEVEPDRHLGEVWPGWVTGWYDFDLGIGNLTPHGWEVTVSATDDLIGWDFECTAWDDPEDPDACTDGHWVEPVDPTTASQIPIGYLQVRGGAAELEEGEEQFVDYYTVSVSLEDSTPIMTGTAFPRQHIGIHDPPPAVQLDLSDWDEGYLPEYGEHRTTLVFTIMTTGTP